MSTQEQLHRLEAPLAGAEVDLLCELEKHIYVFQEGLEDGREGETIESRLRIVEFRKEIEAARMEALKRADAGGFKN